MKLFNYKKIKTKLDLLLLKRNFKRKTKVEKDEWFFIFGYGIGDFYLFLSFVEDFKNYNNVTNLSVGLLKSYQQQLIQVFDLKFSRVLEIQSSDLQFCEENIFCPGKPIVFHPEKFLKNSFLSSIGYKMINLNDIYKFMLNIPIYSLNAVPKEQIQHTEMAKERFFRYGLNKESKIVLIAPHANSFDDSMFPFEFWEKLIWRLKDRGYKVLINTVTQKSQYEIIDGVVCVDFSLVEAISFVNLCGNFIGVRSGFCDLISSSNARKIILYPVFNWYSGSFFSGSSLVKMGLSSHNIYELELDTKQLKDREEEILNIL